MRFLPVRSTLILAVSLAVAGTAAAQTVKRHSFPAAGLAELEVASEVGEIEISPGGGQTVEVEVEFSRRNSGIGGWFSRGPDLAAKDIVIRRSGSRLELSVRDEEVQTEWKIRLPAQGLARTTIAHGVGDVEAEIAKGALEVDLGVGDVDVVLRRADAGAIRLAVGVGDADIRGLPETESSRFVGASVTAMGEGASPVNISIGVGDADITLR